MNGKDEVKMRKIAAIALVITMLFCSTINVLAEGIIDFSVYTLDELMTIQKELESELMSRDGYQIPDMIYRGRYVVGRDIEAGQYLFTCTEVSILVGQPAGVVELSLIIDNDAFRKDGSGTKQIFYDFFINTGYEVILNLEDGMLLELRDCSGTLVVCNQSWTVDNEK